MRLFWKQFLSMVGLVMIAFTIFGSFLMYSSFEKNLEFERQQATQTIQMCQYSLVASLNNLPSDYSMVDVVASDVAGTIYDNISQMNNELYIYNENSRSVYKSAKYESGLIEEYSGESSAITRVEIIEGAHYLDCLIKTDTQAGTYYLEVYHNIENVYESRDELAREYRKILLIVCGITVVIAILLSIQLVRPVRKLTVATKDFADGRYDRRVKANGHDEINMLVESFNQMAGQIEDNIEELKEAARKQEEFTGAFAHELKTPLTSIIGYSEMLRSMDMPENEKNMCADYIYSQGRRLEKLAYKMMELTDIKKQSWQFTRVDVISLVRNVKKMTSSILETKKISLKANCEKGFIYGDCELLESLLSNLIDNARKASNENSAIYIIGRNTKSGYQIKVADYGCGIPKEDIKKIHEAFYMVDKSRARKEGGAGIGMALCEKIILLHHADWNIESELGKGTIVTVDFVNEGGMAENE